MSKKSACIIQIKQIAKYCLKTDLNKIKVRLNKISDSRKYQCQHLYKYNVNKMNIF